MPATMRKKEVFHEIENKPLSAMMIMVCLYIFLVIERPWESIRYLHDLPIERTYAVILILCSLIFGKLVVVKSPVNKWIYGFLLLHFALIPFSYIPMFAFNQSIEYAKMALLYVLLLAVVDDEQDLKVVLKAFVISVAIYALHSLLEFQNGRHVYRMGVTRLIGVDSTYNDPNAFGATLLLSFPFVYALVKAENVRWLKLLYYSYFVTGLLCIILTGSRSAFVGLLFLFGIWILFQKGHKKFLLLFFVTVSLAIGWQALPEEKQERILSIWDKDIGPKNAHQSAEGRINGFFAGIAMFQQSPLTGAGPGGKNFIEYRTNNLDGIPEQSHNLYAEVLGEFGVGGGILFIGLISSIISCCIRARKTFIRSDKEISFLVDLSNMILLCLFLLLLLGLAGHNFYRPLWLWIAAWSGSLWRLSIEHRSITQQTSKHLVNPS